MSIAKSCILGFVSTQISLILYLLVFLVECLPSHVMLIRSNSNNGYFALSRYIAKPTSVTLTLSIQTNCLRLKTTLRRLPTAATAPPSTAFIGI